MGTRFKIKLWPADLLDVSDNVHEYSGENLLGFVDVQVPVLRMLPHERAILVDATRVASNGGKHSSARRGRKA